MSKMPPNSAVLPEGADIRQLRRQAKELLASAMANDRAALDDLQSVHSSRGQDLALWQAQLVVARTYGFVSWPNMRRAVAELSGPVAEPIPAGPIFRAKYLDDTAVFTPRRFLDDASAVGWEPGPLPDAIVYVFAGHFAAMLENDPRFERNYALAPANSIMFTTVDSLVSVGVSCLSPGVGAMVGQIEHQVELGGASNFVILGTAGAIASDLAIGQVVLATSAVRDDGVSQHYLPPDTYVDADVELTLSLGRSLKHSDVRTVEGVTWTLPTPYRSTADEVAHFASEGVGIVETEIASLFAVAEALGVKAAAVSVVARSLVDDKAPVVPKQALPAELLNGVLGALGVTERADTSGTTR
ncbi:MAG: nucleoside phosphorylase [Actinobacteria bacterium]|nr:nucleoside phosphorylase [Actinomycetota bacterium]